MQEVLRFSVYLKNIFSDDLLIENYIKSQSLIHKNCKKEDASKPSPFLQVSICRRWFDLHDQIPKELEACLNI
jgi:hypothetical protein